MIILEKFVRFFVLLFDYIIQIKLILLLLWMFIITILFVLLSTALLTLLERKIMASVQRRRGPNVVGFYGLLQPFADGLKLALKETNVPFSANKFLFITGPLVAFFLAIFGWAFIPFPTYYFFTTSNYNIVLYFNTFGFSHINFDLSLLFIFVITSLHVYGVLIGGWASNSRYALLGALRSTAQSISYELTVGTVVLIIGIFSESLNLYSVMLTQTLIWNFFSLFPIFLLFFICSLAELNRTPFDLVEAEGELVAGYYVEYSAMLFALYFLGEYISIIFSSVFITFLFFGGWLSFFSFKITYLKLLFLCSCLFFSLKILSILILSLLVRFVLPRYRYDQLMYLGWMSLLPLALFFFVTVIVGYLYL